VLPFAALIPLSYTTPPSSFATTAGGGISVYIGHTGSGNQLFWPCETLDGCAIACGTNCSSRPTR
jgi:hypothetical protein